jgi:hypothetical protein
MEQRVVFALMAWEKIKKNRTLVPANIFKAGEELTKA